MGAGPPWLLLQKDVWMKVVLGSGALGKVLLAEHLPSGSQHVITMLNKPDPFRKIIVERVNDERKILSTLDHPFIIEQYCASQDDRQLYIVAEWARGGDPFTNLDKLETFPEHGSKSYAAELVLVIECLHKQSIAHRDIKTENVTLTRSLVRTRKYLAPEQSLKGHSYGKEVDWYALGILIYEMVFGTPPFSSENKTALYAMILLHPVSFLRAIYPHLQELITRLLSERQDGRLGTGGPDEI